MEWHPGPLVGASDGLAWKEGLAVRGCFEGFDGTKVGVDVGSEGLVVGTGVGDAVIGRSEGLGESGFDVGRTPVGDRVGKLTGVEAVGIQSRKPWTVSLLDAAQAFMAGKSVSYGILGTIIGTLDAHSCQDTCQFASGSNLVPSEYI